jgi:hypothetical protein
MAPVPVRCATRIAPGPARRELSCDAAIEGIRMPTSLLQSLWYGEVPLWRTYWIYGVVFTQLVFGLGGALLVVLVGSRLVAVVYLACLAVAIVFILVSIWRSAGNYTGPRIWALLARIACIFGSLSLIRGLYTFFFDGAV